MESPVTTFGITVMHVYDKAEGPSSESSSSVTSIPHEIHTAEDTWLRDNENARTPSDVADSNESYGARRKKRRFASVLKTNDGELDRQL